jgi:hypothetical protein
MSDVFISYRRSGGDLDWAGRIRDALVKDFAVFFDTHIEPGGSIRVNIESALQRCRVFIPVIGPGWVAEKQRLFNQEDWVRKEIATALRRTPPVHVLPILHRDVKFPKGEGYPDELQGFFDSAAFELSHENWDDEVARLKQHLHRKLEGAQPTMSSRAMAPRFLPYLCNRIEQEDALVDSVKKLDPGLAPLVCVMHGSRPEEHMRCIERLENASILDDLFGADGLRVGVHRLDWNRELVRAGRLGDFLRQTLKRQALKKPAASADQLLAFLRAPGRAQLFVLTVTEADLREYGFELLERLTQAWRDLFIDPATAGESASLLTPSHTMVLWLNVFHEGKKLPWHPAPPSIMLPVLSPLEGDDIERWFELEEVRPHIEDREEQVQAILTSPSCVPGQGKVHMELFAREVQRILRQP